MSDGERIDYGSDELPPAGHLAEIIAALQQRSDRLDGHATLEVRAWDDGRIEARLMHTIGLIPGAGNVAPATSREAIVYNDETGAVEYQQYIDRGGQHDIQTRETLVESLSFAESDGGAA